MRTSAESLGLLLGVGLDAALADPRRGHPVAAFGRAAAALERRIYKDSRAAGMLFTGACVGGVAAAALAAAGATRHRPVARGALTAAATWAVLGGTSLGREGTLLAAALESGDLPAARARLPNLCGRDPAALGRTELARATVESIAENASDAVVAPLLCGAVAGVPGLLAYRAINTLDAMVGHHGERYENFGWAAARLDDAVNWLPARLTALLATACAPSGGVRGDGGTDRWGAVRRSYRTLRRDGGAHPSPNAGRCEAAFAGALGVRLGGTNAYGGRVEHRPGLGDGPPPRPADIHRAVRLLKAVTIAATLTAATLAHLKTTARPKVAARGDKRPGRGGGPLS